MKFNTTLSAKNLGSGSRTVLGIVLHDTAGNGGHGDTKYLATDPEKRGVSVDFCVERTGEVYKLNPDLNRYFTFHAGRKTKFKGYTNGAVNRVTVGIEMNQKARLGDWIQGGQPIWPTEQIQAVASLCVWLCKQYKLTKSDIVTHSGIITDHSRSDPRSFPWAQFWDMFNNEIKTGVPGEKNPDVQLADKETYTVQKGDTLYKIATQYKMPVEALKSLNVKKYPNFATPSMLITPGMVLIVSR